MEASTASDGGRHGSRRGGATLLRLKSDEQLVELLREGDEAAFEAIVGRYRSRLFGFCRKMLGSPQDAEDVLQEVLANAYRAMLADRREINLRPWLFRIARNRCLNHLQRIRAVPEEQERLERIPVAEAAVTHERAQNREEFLAMLDDVAELPDAQRHALLLREFDGLSYADVGAEMGASVPAVRSLLTRARASLLEGSEARDLTCPEIKLQIGEAAREGNRVPGPARRHMRDCASCADFGAAVGADARSLAQYTPLGLLALFKGFVASKLGGGAGAGAAAAGAGGAAGGGGAVAGLGIGGWTTGSKVAAGAVVVAVVAAGAGGYAVSNNDSGPANQIAPAVSSGGAQQPAAGPAGGSADSTVGPVASGGAASGDSPGAGAPDANVTTTTPEPSIPGDPDQPGSFVVPPSTYPDGGAPTTGATTTTPTVGPACDPHDPACSSR